MQVIDINQEALDYRLHYTNGEYVEKLYGITDQTIIQLYYFYKKNPQNCIYKVIASPENAGDLFKGKDFTLYNKFGIFIAYSNFDIDFDNRNHLAIIPAETMSDEIALEMFMKNILSDNKITSISCVIEKDYTALDVTEIERDYKIMQKVCPQAFVFNSQFYDLANKNNSDTKGHLFEQIEAQKHIKFIPVSISDLLTEYVFYKDMVISAEKCCALAELIEARVQEVMVKESCSKRQIIIYADDLEDNRARNIYCGIAAYLTMVKGIHCYVDKHDTKNFLEYVRRTTSRQYNYLSDYLRIIKNFPNFVISFSGEFASLCIKDLSRIYKDRQLPIKDRRYSIRLSVYSAKIDIDSFTFKTNVNLQKSIINEEYLEILDFRNYFKLEDPELAICLAEYEKLNNILTNFGKQIRDKTEILAESALNCNNVLLYKYADEYYLGYVSEIDYKLPFKMKPFVDNYDVQQHEFNIEEFKNLFDINIFFDAVLYVDAFTAKNEAYKNNLHFNLNGTAVKGVMLAGIKAAPEKFRTDGPLNFSEIGIWSYQTSQLRQSHLNGLANMMNINELIRSGYLGYYGGLHPSKSIEMIIRPELWR